MYAKSGCRGRGRSARGSARARRASRGPGVPAAPFPELGCRDGGRNVGRAGQLVWMGDNWEWSVLYYRWRRGAEGVALLSWLAAQPPDQVVLLVGNHDLARVGELVAFDQERFQAAQLLADPIYCRQSAGK